MPFAFKVPTPEEVEARRRQVDGASAAAAGVAAFRSLNAGPQVQPQPPPPPPPPPPGGAVAAATSAKAHLRDGGPVAAPPPPQQPAPAAVVAPLPAPAHGPVTAAAAGQLGPARVLPQARPAVMALQGLAPDTAGPAGAPRRAAANKVIVNQNQRGNAVLRAIRSVAWEYGDIAADYQVGQTTGVLFLSLKYHRLKPEYIYERMKGLQHLYLLRVILVIVDIDDYQPTIRELTKATIVAGFTLFMSWSAEEAGKYLETFKAFEHKPPDLIQEKVDGDYMSKLVDCLTQVKSVTKTDVMTLSSTFGSFKRIAEATPEELS
ncbi:Excision repair cross-complementation group 1, partial [Cladochytrium tenue]